MSKLWFFWGQPQMSFLRWATLASACKIHGDVVLVLRGECLKPKVNWREWQDFQVVFSGHNWLFEINRLPLKLVILEEIAPEIAKLRAPDIQTADLLSWWLLAKHGGTVADMDIVFLKPLPEITRNVQVVVFSGHPKPNYIPVTIMQGKPCSTWRETYNNAIKNYDPDDYESCGSKVLIPKPGEPLIAPGLDERIVFPWAGKHPWSNWHNWMFGAKEWPEIPETCCGIHWYAGRNQKWNQCIKSKNDLGDGAIPWVIGEVLKDESISR